jgi:hypothetical protein
MSAILMKIDIPIVINLLENLLDDLLVPGIGCPDKIIIGNVQPGPQIPKQPADMVGVFLGRLAVLLGGLNDLVAVLVRTGQKKGRVPCQTMEPTLGISDNSGITVP